MFSILNWIDKHWNKASLKKFKKKNDSSYGDTYFHICVIILDILRLMYTLNKDYIVTHLLGFFLSVAWYTSWTKILSGFVSFRVWQYSWKMLIFYLKMNLFSSG